MIFLELMSLLMSNNEFDYGVRQVGYVLEINTMKNGVSLRNNPLLEERFRNIVLSESQVSELVDGLSKLTKDDTKDKKPIAWALSKSFNQRACPSLKYIANAAIADSNDGLLFQSLIGIENCCLRESWDFITEVSYLDFLEDSSEFAQKKDFET